MQTGGQPTCDEHGFFFLILICGPICVPTTDFKLGIHSFSLRFFCSFFCHPASSYEVEIYTECASLSFFLSFFIFSSFSFFNFHRVFVGSFSCPRVFHPPVCVFFKVIRTSSFEQVKEFICKKEKIWSNEKG